MLYMFRYSSCVSFPNCDHYTCFPCHERCWFGPPDLSSEVEFPYNSFIKELYLKNRDQFNNDPNIIKYKKKLYEASQKWEDEFENESHLRKCPICRQ
jgi:hypothetical protein